MRFLTQVIVDLGFAPRERVEAAMLAARDAGTTPDQLLVDQGVITAEQRAQAIAERLGLDLDLTQYRLDMAAVNLLPPDVARRCELVPVARNGEDTLVVAMADPANVVAIDDVEIQTGMNVQVAVATREDILAVIANMTRLDSAVTDVVDEESHPEVEMFDVHDAATETPIVKLVNALLSQAVTHGASDVHFEAEAREMRVRFRVDGVLEETPGSRADGARAWSRASRSCASSTSPSAVCPRTVAQAQHRRPADRLPRLDVADGPRRVGRDAHPRPLQRAHRHPKLGLDDFSLGRLDAATGHAHGSVLVTGPTGSGKSTTLYAVLNSLNTIDKNILTIEDPVEYHLRRRHPGRRQRALGPDLRRGLRAMLRADPDIIMVGEIRDRETAQIGIEAALTGHLVLSTLHTNDAPSSITRLLDMGIEPFLISSSVIGVIAQRLARVLCTGCKRAGDARGRRAGARRAFTSSHDIAGLRGRRLPALQRQRLPAAASASTRSCPSPTRSATWPCTAPRRTGSWRPRAREGMRTLREDAFEKVKAGRHRPSTKSSAY